ncbi:MAG: recombination protein RecR, partial [Lachnospiraceae bacterium]|nr:recombination protein RecR [Lachnospiraceae bacterium]
MDLYSGMMSRLIEEFASLPGIGRKSAQRLAFHIVNMPKDRVRQFAETMVDARERIRYCSV